MIEVEIKVRIEDPDDLRNKFAKNDGKYIISLLHEDTYFNMPEDHRDFKKTDEALRVRKSTEFNRNIENSEENPIYFITYKGKKLDETSKTRKEIETKVENGLDLIEILEALGFKKIFTINKERELYKFHFKGQEIEALIDYIPLLKQHFMEVEIMLEEINELEEKRSFLFNFLKKFDINEEDSIRKSYLELIADKFRKKK